MNNIENLFDYTVGQFEFIDHLFTMGVGVHLAALVFFLVVSQFVAPKYRIATALSCIVMVSAGLILNSQAAMWTDSFAYVDGTYQLQDLTFSNGYRYVNWMATIPCLLVQLLIVLNLKGKELFSTATYLILAAWGMIITGYVGQLYEVSDLSALMYWGAASTVFFVIMNFIVGKKIGAQKASMLGGTNSTIMKVFWLMMFAWTLYPIAYLVPYFMNSADGVVLRQVLFTVADISSKVIYGLMITYIAVNQSAAAGYVPAQQALGRIGVDHKAA
ncbi:Bacteriorhodopsin [Nonlabens sp. YIK11]|uniref:bacteriorhodopsin n=1 Tax=Nonlabens sp. YIK11 TaxID=1453349 RepID=UPI00051CBC7E|nr:bacteriorhodopsin [Nonlabens sp. YIK11]AIT18215.1 chloride ion rhodopsin [Nonlabens sp. YIK11]KQC33018.1 Bacteriorhodopsin [Nonlabens sp. YIK11]